MQRTVYLDNVKERDLLAVLGVNERIILIWISKDIVEGCGMDSCGSG
jgi:hypothetical protein